MYLSFYVIYYVLFKITAQSKIKCAVYIESQHRKTYEKKERIMRKNLIHTVTCLEPFSIMAVYHVYTDYVVLILRGYIYEFFVSFSVW